MKMKRITFLCAASLMIALASCGKDAEDLVQFAVGEYKYEASYYDNEEDALVDGYYANEKEGELTTDVKPPVSTSKGTLIVEGIEKTVKLRITLDNGMSFETNKIKADSWINPSNCFNFTIPRQETSEGEIKGINVYKNPDKELFQGSFYGYKGDEELKFGFKFLGGDKQAIRFKAEKK